MDKQHTAYRFIGTNKAAYYVSDIDYSRDRKGDKYGYTTEASKALKMAPKECRDFCAYMRDCGTVGFWC